MPENSDIRLNVLTGTEVMVNALSPAIPGKNYQYLIPAWGSVYGAMGETDPVYKELSAIASCPDNCLYVVPGEELRALSESELIKKSAVRMILL